MTTKPVIPDLEKARRVLWGRHTPMVIRLRKKRRARFLAMRSREEAEMREERRAA